MANASPVVDAMVKEYLIFRGFTASLKSFDMDTKNDRNKMFRVDNIVHQFSTFIHTYDVTSLKSYWTHFDANFFSRLGYDAYKVIKKIEINVLRFYIVHALQNNKIDKVQEFFEKYANELCQEDCWKEWFLIPFMKNPEMSKTFSMYFTKIWQDSVLLSLSNCLDTVFAHMKRPLLLNFQDDYHKLKALVDENKKLKEQITLLQKDLTRFKNQQSSEKVNASVQTNDMDEMQLEDKNRRKPPRFAWKLLGTKEKDSKVYNKSLPLKETGNSLLRNSLDENAMRRLMASSSSQLSTGNIITEEESATPPVDISTGINMTENQSTFYASLSNSYKKSLSFAGQSSNTKQENVNNNTETPFILLSKDEFKDHTSPIVSASFSDNSSTVASLDTDGVLKFWDYYPSISKTANITLKENVLSFDWLHNVDNKIFLGRSIGTIAIFDTTQKRFLWESSVHPKYKSVSCVACSPVTNNAVCSILAPLAKKSTKDTTQSSKMIKLKQYTSFSESSSTRQGALSVWDLQTGQQKCEICLDPFPVCVHSLSYNHNGSLIVTGGADGMIRLFDAHNSDCLVGWHAHSTNVLDVIFSADETSIYSLGSDGKLCVWDINKVSYKISEFPLPLSSTGFARYNNVKDLGSNYMEDMPYIKLLSSDSDGEHVMACNDKGLVIYQASTKSELEEVMLLDFPKNDILTLDWTSSPNCSTALCGCRNGSIYTTTLLKR